jgi:hypothetical protein
MDTETSDRFRGSESATLTREEMDEIYGVVRVSEEGEEWPRPRECRGRMPNGDPASAVLWGVGEE